MSEPTEDQLQYARELAEKERGGWIVSIRIGSRSDGGIRVWSDDVPGLILSGSDPEKVMASVMPALQALNAWPA